MSFEVFGLHYFSSSIPSFLLEAIKDKFAMEWRPVFQITIFTISHVKASLYNENAFGATRAVKLTNHGFIFDNDEKNKNESRLFLILYLHGL